MKRFIIFAISCAAVLTVVSYVDATMIVQSGAKHSYSASGGEDTSTTIRYEDYENPTGDGCEFSALGFHYPFDHGDPEEAVAPAVFVDGNEWDCEHLPDGGEDGTGDGAAHYTLSATVRQVNTGWTHGSPGGSWPAGSTVYIGFRVRFDDTSALPPSLKLKFIVFGSGSSTPYENRVIIYMEGPDGGGGSGCYPNGESYTDSPFIPDDDPGGDHQPHAFGLPDAFGLTLSGNRFSTSGPYWGMWAQRGVSGEDLCGGLVIMARGNHTWPMGSESAPNAGPPTNGWTQVLWAITSGDPGDANIKVWANDNCDPDNPSYTRPIGNTGEGLGSAGSWASYNPQIVSHPDDANSADISLRIDDYILARDGFPSTWCAGGTPP